MCHARTGLGKGSGRSIDGVSLIAALRACAEHLELFGGHDMAAGLNIRAERVDVFREAFNRHVRAAAADELFQPALDLAGVFAPGEVGRALFDQLGRLSPFGRHHPEPIFVFEPISYLRPPRAFGRDHIKLFPGRRGECGAGGGRLRAGAARLVAAPGSAGGGARLGRPTATG